MKRSIFAAAAALLMMATAAQASTEYLSRKGSWSTYVANNLENGKPLCGMQVTGRSVSLMVKYAPGSKLFIQIFKSDWNIPEDTDIPGYLAFDNSEHFPFEGVGGKGPNGEGVVTLGIKPGTEDDFLGLIADASKMTVGFNTGTQPPLVADMRGSREAVNVFRWCSHKLDAQADAPQPFAKQPAPQPFGSKPQTKVAPAASDNGGI